MAASLTFTCQITDAMIARADVAVLNALESGEGQWNPPLETPDIRPPLSRSQIQRLIDEKRVTVDGRPTKANVKLKAGNIVRVEFHPPKPMELIPEDRPLEILYEDEHLLVVNKPQGLTVHPSSTQSEGTLVHALLHHVKDLSGIGGVMRPGIVHRIDKDTSGALVITKTDQAHQGLMETFSKHLIERKYWALCYGNFKETKANAEEKIESLIDRSPTDRKKMSMNVKTGRQAVTYLKKLEEYGVSHAKPFATWVEARLETGRTHQVRVHLTGYGNSIMGDLVYGVPGPRHPKLLALPEDVRSAVLALPGQALHARILGFDHPVTGKRLRFEAEAPPAFKLLLEAMQRYR